MKHITIEELSAMRNTEGIIIQGCGGDLNDWVEGINQLLTCEGIFKNNDIFKEVLVFEYSGLTNLLFKMDGVGLDIGKLALWRISTHWNFGGTWLSNYLPNKLGIHMDKAIEEKQDPEQEFDLQQKWQ